MKRVLACRTCDLVQEIDSLQKGTLAACARCETPLAFRKPNSRTRTAAFALAALILYLPANLYPIMRMHYLGSYSENTIWEGCRSLIEKGEWFVGIVVFLASILVPFLKLLGLFFLVITADSTAIQKQRTQVYKFIRWIGPWAMLDVFLLSILVAVLKLEQMATVLPGPGIVAFTAVVVLSLLASASFDSRLIWDEEKEKQ